LSFFTYFYVLLYNHLHSLCRFSYIVSYVSFFVQGFDSESFDCYLSHFQISLVLVVSMFLSRIVTSLSRIYERYDIVNFRSVLQVFSLSSFFEQTISFIFPSGLDSTTQVTFCLKNNCFWRLISYKLWVVKWTVSIKNRNKKYYR
jgi:hypothetical protein